MKWKIAKSIIYHFKPQEPRISSSLAEVPVPCAPAQGYISSGKGTDRGAVGGHFEELEIGRREI